MYNIYAIQFGIFDPHLLPELSCTPNDLHAIYFPGFWTNQGELEEWLPLTIGCIAPLLRVAPAVGRASQ